MYKIDLNSDLGEGALFDADIIPLITSANVACGFHAGGCALMKKTVELCKSNSVFFGAHPGYPDRENFGRTNMDVTPEQVYEYTLYQLGALGAFAKANGVKMSHVKPHGAMYNMAAKNAELSNAIVDAVKDFADRAYESDGTLRARKLEGSMITDENEAINRVIRMIKEGKVTSYTGEDIDIEAHSVCVHGDGEKALDFVRALNKAFVENGIKTAPLSEVIG